MIDSTQESYEQFIGFMRFLARQVGGAFEAKGDGIEACALQVPIAFLNPIFISSRVKDADDMSRRLSVAAELAKSIHAPSYVTASSDWLPDGSADVLACHGLMTMMTVTGMVASELLPARRPSPVELEIRTEYAEELVNDLLDVNCHAYGMPLEIARGTYRRGLLATDSYVAVGYVDGQPVSASVSLPVDGKLYAGWVATTPELRGRGYAEAVMRRSLVDGERATGFSRTVLHATTAGLPLYQSMGYQAVTEFPIWIPQGA